MMTIRDIMKYIESEYKVINQTPCEVCGGEYLTEDLDITLVDGIPFDVCDCVCASCGYIKSFMFTAPFVEEDNGLEIIKRLN
ncbi:putative metal-binding protein [Clostridium putrefaciens]|uniref:Putative metal-binding protein n=2 Tax=Clostridium putrefaciens TaxID=99675 RepID=A0A381JD71_9CLOT|nr:putative metal-binding protein [Clostridium putrefaciens]